ncbi:MAG: hypothetical protein ACTSQJ_00490 [Promethearchaeota archaeon]
MSIKGVYTKFGYYIYSPELKNAPLDYFVTLIDGSYYLVKKEGDKIVFRMKIGKKLN